MDFLEQQKQVGKVLGFWVEEPRTTTIHALEMQFTTDIIQNYYIDDLVQNGDVTLIKWMKRPYPLSAEQLEKKYGR